MPQRDDKVGIHFGRISSECWDSLGNYPGAVVEEAVQLLDRERRNGREIIYPATLRSGITKKLWLKPATVDLLNEISDQTGIRKTPLILAALELYWTTPEGDAEKHRRNPITGR